MAYLAGVSFVSEPVVVTALWEVPVVSTHILVRRLPVASPCSVDVTRPFFMSSTFSELGNPCLALQPV